MKKTSNYLFDNAGFILVRSYLDDINQLRKSNTWKIPFSFFDNVQLKFLTLLIKISWFSNRLYIAHESNISPAFSILLNFLIKKDVLDIISERDLQTTTKHSFYATKKIKINDHEENLNGQGVSWDKATAFSTALGEIFERMITGVYDVNKKIIIDSPARLGIMNEIFYPPKHHRFLDIQIKKFQFLKYDPNEIIEWVIGQNLVTNKKVYIPRTITSWFHRGKTKNKVLMNATTNGAAGYFTKEGAVLRGLLEIIQRDAFLMHWLTITPPRILDKDSLPQSIKENINEFESFGIEIYLLDITAIPVPTILAVGINKESDVPQVVISSSSNMNYEEAIESSLKEMVTSAQMYYYDDKTNFKAPSTQDYKPFISKIGKIERQLFWRGHDRIKEFNWFLQGEKISYQQLQKDDLNSEDNDLSKLNICIDILRKIGSDYYPIVYYPKNKLQKELNFYVAQVFIPKTIPFYLYEQYGTFDSDRLNDFAASKNKKNWKLNQLPHMFS